MDYCNFKLLLILKFLVYCRVTWFLTQKNRYLNCYRKNNSIIFTDRRKFWATVGGMGWRLSNPSHQMSMVVSRIVPSSEAEASRFACVGFHATAFTSSECTSSSFWSRRSVSQPSTFATSKILQIVKMLEISYIYRKRKLKSIIFCGAILFQVPLVKVELKET